MEKIGEDFTSGSIMKHLLVFLVPFLLANILNSIYNIVDMVIIGNYVGSVGTVAVSLGGRLSMLLTSVSIGLSGGGQILIAQEVGAGRREELNRTIGTLFSELFLVSVFFMAVCLLFARPILVLLNTPAESFDETLSYFIITTVGLPFIFAYNAISSVLRGMGDSKNPLLFVAIAAFMNLGLDLVFVIKLGLGARGTACATVIGQGVSVLFSIVLLFRRRERFYFDFKLKSFAIDKDKLKIMLDVGIPLAFKGGMIQITQLWVMGLVNTFGLIQAAAYGIGDKILQLSNIVCQCAQQAGGVISGQNFAAGKYGRVKQVIYSSLVITGAMAVLMSVFSLLLPEAIFGLFTKDAKVLGYSRNFMKISVVVYFLACLGSSAGTITTGTGNSKLAFLSGFLDGVVFRICLGVLFAFYLNMQSAGLFLGNALARLGPIIIEGGYFVSNAWMNKKTLLGEAEKKAGIK